MKKRVADIIMDILVENKITDCFMVSGGGAMHLDNALALNTSITKYFNHHEQACSMAAEAYARIDGKVAAVCVTSGPGATNAITGVLGAFVDSIPMIVISGQVRYETSVEHSGLPLRYRGVQEFDIISAVKKITKYAKQIVDPKSIKEELEKAIYLAKQGRKGPVWLDVPLDVQGTLLESDDLRSLNIDQFESPSISLNDWNNAYNLLSNAKRPCILAGSGIISANQLREFRKFTQTISIPVVSAAIATDVLYRDHPLFFGLCGTVGTRSGNFIIQNADVILAIGTSLGFKMTGFAQEKFATNAHIIAVDIDENEFKKPGLKITQLIKSEIGDFFRFVEPHAKKINVDKEWLHYCNDLRTRFSPFENSHYTNNEHRVGAYYFWEKFDEFLPKDAIVSLGNNTASVIRIQVGMKSEGQRLITNVNCGSMGSDLPYAIGAAIAAKKPIICATGDGSIMMNLQELETITQHNLPIKVIIFSNDGYAAIRQTSKSFFNGLMLGCSEQSGLKFPSFQDVSKTFNFSYKRCKNNDEIEECLKWFFALQGRAILEIDQCIDDPISPKVTSRLNTDGTFATPALHDMFPFLPEEEVQNHMF